MLAYIIFAIIGLVLGSFSNALIYRLPRRISLLNPKRSRCPSCDNQISGFDNIPVLSWFLLGGQCRSCKNPISVKYPLVEIVNGFAGFYALYHYQDIPTALLAYLLFNILIVITIIDLEFMIIPDKINKPGMVFGLLLGGANQIFKVFQFPFAQTFLESLIGLAVGYGLLFIIAWGYYKATNVSGLGGGDIKLMGFIGALFGPLAIPSILITGSLIGVVIGIFVIVAKRYSARTELPFGPSLAVGILCHMLGIDVIGLINFYIAYLLAPHLVNG